VVAAFEAGQAGWLRLDAAGLLTDAGVARAESLCEAGNLRTWPHLHSTDGFFAVAWQKI
jgi:16S rRNA (cytosine967-C5)-methyltransferase